MKKTYRTININSEYLLKEKQSKFFGFAFPVSEIGITKTIYRLNDDGEPRNTAGLPIYGQIQSFDLTNILIVVVRYFGGTKLGVGGLVSAYKECAKLTIVANKIIRKEIIIPIKIKFEYPLMNSVMRIIKEYHLEIENQEMHTSCIFEILTTKKNNVTVINQFKQNPGIEIL